MGRLVNQGATNKLLVGFVWSIGMPMIVLGGLYGIPRALLPGALLTRAAWAGVPVVGFAIVIACIFALWRRQVRAGGAVFERQWLGRYYVELLVATLVYIALSIACVRLIPTIHDPVRRGLAGLAPAIGIALILIAIVRWVRCADEFQRARLLESFAVVAAITGLWTWTYGLLEVAGFPRLSMFWVWGVMVAVWLIWSGARVILQR
jgi:hypothetical protein